MWKARIFGANVRNNYALFVSFLQWISLSIEFVRGIFCWRNKCDLIEVVSIYRSHFLLESISVVVFLTRQLCVCQGLITADYELFGHRDGRLNTSCPGDALYALIRTWPHYSRRHIHKYGVSSSSSSSSSNSVASPPRHLFNVRTSLDRTNMDNSVVQRLW